MTGPAPFAEFPPEIVDQILAQLCDSPPALRSCTLVCRSWLPSARYQLHGSVGLSRNLVQPFIKLTESPGNPFTSILHSLSLVQLGDLSHMRPVLVHLLALRSLRLQSYVLSATFPNLPHLTSLSLHSVRFASPTGFSKFMSHFPRH
jgi:hypothetical protein